MWWTREHPSSHWVDRFSRVDRPALVHLKGLLMTTSTALHVARNARKFPSRTALIGESGRMTYAELDLKSTQLASYLIDQGIAVGDKIGLLAKSSINWVVGYIAILKTRAVCVPVNYRLTADDCMANLIDAECRLVMTTSDFARSHLAERADLPLVLLDDSSHPNSLGIILRHQDHPIADLVPADDDLALILYTGGTTGRSKGVMLTNANIFWNTVQEALDTEMSEFDNTILATPLHHGAALNCWLLPHLYLGASATIMSDYSADRMIAMIEEHKVTNGFTPPSVAREICTAGEATPARLASFQRWYVGGGILSAKDRDRMHALIPGVRIFFQYGLTEAGVIVTVLKEEDFDDASESIGRPFVNFEVRVARDNMSDADLGECGEILVRGPSVMRGYYKRPDATAAVFHDGWLRTGDVGSMDASGFLYFHDRLKDMVKTGGLNVYSQEVERLMLRHSAVREVGVIGLPSDRWGEEVIAVVVLKDGAEATAAELIAHARSCMAGYQTPKRVVFIAYEELPINQSGKILKRDLRSRIMTLEPEIEG